MDSHSVILRIDECLRTAPALRSDGPSRAELLRICEHNPHLTGTQLFDAFRGHLDIATLRALVSTWDTWRVLSMSRTRRRTIAERAGGRSARCNDHVRGRKEREVAELARR